MIEQYEVVWMGDKVGEGVWGVVEVDRSRGIIYILLNGQSLEDVANGRPINALDKGGIVRTVEDKIYFQNSCELVRQVIQKHLKSCNDFRQVFGMS